MIKIILSNLFLLSALIVCGQDTTYFDSKWNNVSSMNKAEYYKTVVYNQTDTNKVIETSYFKNGQIRLQRHYSDYKNYILDGKVKEWNKNGQIRKDIDYNDGKLNGRLLTYWDNGKPKRIDKFKYDEFINGKCFNSKGIEIEHSDYEILPVFPGGINKLYEYLGKEIIYPSKSRENGIEGSVIVNFIVNVNGYISDIKIAQSVNDELNEESIRVIKNMPKWEPGMQDGEVIRVSYNLPIKYRLK